VSTQQATAQALLQFESELSLVQADNTITSNAYNYAKILVAASMACRIGPKNGETGTGNRL
jgi:hypothetical protein